MKGHGFAALAALTFAAACQQEPTAPNSTNADKSAPAEKPSNAEPLEPEAKPPEPEPVPAGPPPHVAPSGTVQGVAFAPDTVRRVDFNGDGRDDYVVHLEDAKCSSFESIF